MQRICRPATGNLVGRRKLRFADPTLRLLDNFEDVLAEAVGKPEWFEGCVEQVAKRYVVDFKRHVLPQLLGDRR